MFKRPCQARRSQISVLDINRPITEGDGASCSRDRVRPEDRKYRCLTSTAPLRKRAARPAGCRVCARDSVAHRLYDQCAYLVGCQALDDCYHRRVWRWSSGSETMEPSAFSALACSERFWSGQSTLAYRRKMLPRDEDRNAGKPSGWHRGRHRLPGRAVQAHECSNERHGNMASADKCVATTDHIDVEQHASDHAGNCQRE